MVERSPSVRMATQSRGHGTPSLLTLSILFSTLLIIRRRFPILREVRLPRVVPQTRKRVRHIGMLPDRFLIDVQSQARLFRRYEPPVSEGVPAFHEAISPRD